MSPRLVGRAAAAGGPWRAPGRRRCERSSRPRPAHGDLARRQPGTASGRVDLAFAGLRPADGLGRRVAFSVRAEKLPPPDRQAWMAVRGLLRRRGVARDVRRDAGGHGPCEQPAGRRAESDHAQVGRAVRSRCASSMPSPSCRRRSTVTRPAPTMERPGSASTADAVRPARSVCGKPATARLTARWVTCVRVHGEDRRHGAPRSHSRRLLAAPDGVPRPHASDGFTWLPRGKV